MVALLSKSPKATPQPKSPKATPQHREKHTHFTQMPNFLLEDAAWMIRLPEKDGHSTVKPASYGTRAVFFKMLMRLNTTNNYRYQGASERSFARYLNVKPCDVARALPLLAQLGFIQYQWGDDGIFRLIIRIKLIWKKNDEFYSQKKSATILDPWTNFFDLTDDAKDEDDDAKDEDGDTNCDKSDASLRSNRGGNTDSNTSFGNTPEEEGTAAPAHSYVEENQEEDTTPSSPNDEEEERTFDPSLVSDRIKAIAQEVAEKLRLPINPALLYLVQEYDTKYPDLNQVWVAIETRNFVDSERNVRGLPMCVNRYETSLKYQARIREGTFPASSRERGGALPPPSSIDPVIREERYLERKLTEYEKLILKYRPEFRFKDSLDALLDRKAYLAYEAAYLEVEEYVLEQEGFNQ